MLFRRKKQDLSETGQKKNPADKAAELVSDAKKTKPKKGKLKRAFMKAAVAGALLLVSYEAAPDNLRHMTNDTVNVMLGTHVLGERLNDSRPMPLIFGGVASRDVMRSNAVVDRWFQMRDRHEITLNNPAYRAELNEYYSQFEHLRGKPIAEQVRGVDGIVDRQVRYTSDGETFCSSDYWAAPLETARLKKGDCEDFAILKYYALRHLGVPAGRMWVAAVGADGADRITHATLVVDTGTPVPGQPYTPNFVVLENDGAPNLIPIARADAAPFMVFNEEGIWRITPPPESIRPPQPAPPPGQQTTPQPPQQNNRPVPPPPTCTLPLR